MTAWIEVNLPWSEPDEDDPQRPPFPYQEMEAAERELFEGQTITELMNARLSKLSQDDSDYQKKRDALSEEMDKLWEEKVAIIPVYQTWKASLEAAREETSRRYFRYQAKPGMVVETITGGIFLLGHVDARGGIGTEHFPLKGETILRYCMVDLPPECR